MEPVVALNLPDRHTTSQVRWANLEGWFTDELPLRSYGAGHGLMPRLPSSLAAAAVACEALSGSAASATHRTGSDAHPVLVLPQAARIGQHHMLVEEPPAAIPADCAPPSAGAASRPPATRRSGLSQTLSAARAPESAR